MSLLYSYWCVVFAGVQVLRLLGECLVIEDCREVEGYPIACRTWFLNLVVGLPHFLRGFELVNHVVGVWTRKDFHETREERDDQKVYEICSGLPERRNVGTRVLHGTRCNASHHLHVPLADELFCNRQRPLLVYRERPEGMEDVRTPHDEAEQLQANIYSSLTLSYVPHGCFLNWVPQQLLNPGLSTISERGS